MLRWKLFLPYFNGISMMLLDEPDENFSCDACPSGCGGIMQSWCLHETFPPNIVKRKLHIYALELLTIVVALKPWGKLLRGKKVLIFL